MNVRNLALITAIATILPLTGCDKISEIIKGKSESAANGGSAASIAPVEPGKSDFEVWKTNNASVDDSAATSPDGTMDADILTLQPGGSMLTFDSRVPVVAGDEFRSSIWMWAESPVKLRIRISRHCESIAPEQFLKVVEVGATPTKYEVMGTFTESHKCARFQLDNPSDVPVTVTAWKAHTEKVLDARS